MERQARLERPSPAMWLAWGLALLGGLLVTAAVITALLDPCVRTRACTEVSLAGAGYLALAGTAAAVVGGIASAALLVRRRR
ncbi:hypothetical protein [Egicoccus sp. AB-alg6-2]|uniref:hypothetical protein n=1 Tax=Egicoccus sp. AB-alg6-2 TaxID=3242692 RepID=UPI00359E2B87